jgi:hypothetical protein
MYIQIAHHLLNSKDNNICKWLIEFVVISDNNQKNKSIQNIKEKITIKVKLTC